MSLIPSTIELPSDQQLLVEAAGDFAENELLSRDRQWDVDESSVAEVLPQLGEMGFLTLMLPEELGGLHCSMRLYAALLHEIAYWSPSTAVTLSVHNMVAKILSRKLTDPFRTKLLSEFGASKNFAAFAVSEADAGSDVAAIKTTARVVERGYRVSGEKMWITNGMHGRWFLTLVRLTDVPEEEQLCALLIDGNEKGFSRTKIQGKMGIRGSETAVIGLDEVFVPDHHLLGEWGEGLVVCLSTLNEGRIAIAVQASGIAEACLDEMRRYARQRVQFDQPIGQFPAIQTMIADSAVELEAAKLLIWRAATYFDRDHPDRSVSSMAKLAATEWANRIAYRAVQVHGGAGYVNECRAEQLYRDVRVTTIYEGTSEVQRVIIGRELDRHFEVDERTV